ncbi:hypothetical protein MO867_19590 [Microbulbifer sp. OS29]|uniref:Peptidase M61 catalytic domain-containing protein n=1 Tax=Microbulbifer okhotskensis TaxID=2926617 RepID=A0A9X2J6S3_9GAMM|nr:hypothetical protein [Microbulbifer okhotskensis]MCO1336538.1 hypothetical protein [Microbulbifer okhotskensis]
MLRKLLTLTLLLVTLSPASRAYEILYTAEIHPDSKVAKVEIALSGKDLPSRLTLNLSSGRYQNLKSDGPLELEGDKAIWRPKGTKARLQYRFVIDNQRSNGGYDSRITNNWAILRSDKLIVPVSAKSSGRSVARLQLKLPEEWSAALPYPNIENHLYQLSDPKRKFVRPKGWMIVGKIGSRQDVIANTATRVAGPKEENIRRQDILAFLNWNLPELKKIFPLFPDQLLIVTADDPMWRGGLSGTRSLYMHADRPLISGNRTSSMIHELVHVGTGIHGDDESDWIVEGLAEFYSLEILRRTGGISEIRYKEAIENLATWGQGVPSLLVKRSSGPITARAVGVMQQLDKEIRVASGGKASIDDVARGLASSRGEVTLERFRSLSEQAAGRPVEALGFENLTNEKSQLAKKQAKKSPDDGGGERQGQDH